MGLVGLVGIGRIGVIGGIGGIAWISKTGETDELILQPGSKPKPYRIALGPFWKSWPAHPKPNGAKLISKAS